MPCSFANDKKNYLLSFLNICCKASYIVRTFHDIGNSHIFSKSWEVNVSGEGGDDTLYSGVYEV